MGDPALIGNIESDITADIDIDNIRPGGAPLVLEGQYASITIIINSEAELGILEIMNPDSNNVATFAISVLDDDDTSPQLIAQVSGSTINASILVKRKKQTKKTRRYEIKCARRVSVITFTRYVQYRNNGKPNNIKVFWSDKQKSQNRIAQIC
jgi:hypothetical protein